MEKGELKWGWQLLSLYRLSVTVWPQDAIQIWTKRQDPRVIQCYLSSIVLLGSLVSWHTSVFAR